MKPLHILGLGFWTPGYPTPAAWLEQMPDPAVTRPPCAMLNPRIGRYTSQVTRMAIEALAQAGAQGAVDLGRVPTVFGSANGEIQIAFQQLDMIAADGVPSPARFKNSVHNTASGHVSIATENMAFSTALAAGSATFAMCILEAWMWLHAHPGTVIVSVADESLPEHLSSFGAYDPLGLALCLSSAPAPAKNLGTISELKRRREGLAAPAIPERFAANPVAVGIALMEAVLHGRGGIIPIQVGGEGWSVAYEPAGRVGP